MAFERPQQLTAFDAGLGGSRCGARSASSARACSSAPGRPLQDATPSRYDVEQLRENRMEQRFEI